LREKDDGSLKSEWTGPTERKNAERNLKGGLKQNVLKGHRQLRSQGRKKKRD